MTYPNTPLDPPIHLLGWPWHGRVSSEPVGNSAPNGTLTTAGGRTVPVGNAHASTALWDIGLPDVTLDAPEPDEQWLGKAILRCSSDGRLYAYGGAEVTGLLSVPGRGTVRRSFDVRVGSAYDDALGRYVPELYGYVYNDTSGVATESAGLTSRALGVPYALLGSSLQLEWADVSRDGCGNLYIVHMSAGTGEIYLARAVVELLMTPAVLEDGQIFVTPSLHKIAGFDDFVSTGPETATTDLTPWTNTEWADADGAAPNVIRPHGAGPPDGGEWVAIASWVEATLDVHLTLRHPWWAWYTADGPQVVWFELSVDSRRAYTRGDGQDIEGELDYRASLAAGDERVSLDMRSTFATSEKPNDLPFPHLSDTLVRGDWSMTLNGDEFSSQTAGWTQTDVSQDVTFGITGLPFARCITMSEWKKYTAVNWDVVTLRGVQPLSDGSAISTRRLREIPKVPFSMLSNKIFGAGRIAHYDDNDVLSLEEIGDALTPSGIDEGTYTIQPEASSEQRRGFFSGSYNPITGEVARNVPGWLHSWI